MTECFNCGISTQNARLYDAVLGSGIMKICSNCANSENIPVIKKPTTFQLKEAEQDKKFHERASEFKKKGFPRKDLEKNEITLREIVERNYEKRLPKDFKLRPDLVKNFHWVLMRSRRMKKLTQEQLAKELQESISAIKMAEQGILPEDDYRLVNKLESFLGVNIVKPEFAKVAKPKKDYFNFDRSSAREITLEDLKEMRKKELEMKKKLEESEEFSLESEEDVFEESLENEPEFGRENDSNEISKDEMDRIVFGR